MSFAKFLRTLFLKEHLQQLLLSGYLLVASDKLPAFYERKSSSYVLVPFKLYQINQSLVLKGYF